GGSGGGIASTMEELESIVTSGLSASLSREVLVEQCLLGWKELEYEVMRDAAGNCIIVCNMENIDPLGVHTGDSIVVAPSQTLSDKDYQMLRSASINIIRALKIEGGCNVQFALAPGPIVAGRWAPKLRQADSSRYYVIEVNPRVSRSSALASKATGYPIARVAAKIAVGRTLDEIQNKVTGKTMAAFEPALDYCVVKIPRWPFDKFKSGDRRLGSQMKATGEVMAIDRTFEAALHKAVRSLEFGRKTMLWEDHSWGNDGKLESYPLHANDLRLWALMAALRRGFSPDNLARHTGIDPWFLYKMRNLVQMERRLLAEQLTPELLLQSKRQGFSDEEIGTLADKLPEQVRRTRQEWKLFPAYKMVDTCAAEFAAETPYFYSTYELENEAEPITQNKSVVIGSGPIRIGQGIEFDYCSVHAAWALHAMGIKSIMANSNPETVSTDFDTSDRLYFEPLDEESVRDILDNEAGVNGVKAPEPTAIVQFGGQTAINLAESLARSGTKLLGSSAEAIDLAEDRGRFEDFLHRLGIPQPPGAGINNMEEALNVARLIGYPVLVRPSYVLGGRAMEIVHNESEIARYITQAFEEGSKTSKHPVLIDKYLQGKECEVDAICDGEQVLIPGVMEHIERAGVHSGDSMAMYPALNLTDEEVHMLVDYTTRMGLGLQIRGLMNVQFVILRDGGKSKVYVLEVNPRGSRTVPFISKVTNVPMVRIAIGVMLGQSLGQQGYAGGLCKRQKLVAIKAPVFSMSKLVGVDTYLGPEMKSTGEVMGIDHNFEGALVKSLMASGLMLPQKGAILVSVADRDKPEALPILKKLATLDYRMYATEGTALTLKGAGIPVTLLTKKLNEGHPNVVDVISDGTVSAVINTITGGKVPLHDGFQIRRAAAEKRIPCFTSLDTARVAVDALVSGSHAYHVAPLNEYVSS
ncbi:MAG: carbamoyl-phosphate synthase large subunit, partial [Dehalococcoidia bacterium]|nr:carbamoyl-phosphate synthase large subunit [Dehalococcoidia bacterium]